mmetsp:Transcript_1856/g.2847  ORF Transcript_1856/g.2847 Transcript_1856/m.2847 type:complete len:518 (+) Transcript_1856:80-1633(+)|eukprot:CAMPEP_0194204548 /NCGR_PEP_ID=MMETSP0156-20130528/4038_1 /TAXON_ID=33649 /ORGANISM="Thalassionema nitzschioides, Strain L26-B" /LENGTH=517 /DNA_ID=CAMNT_0038930591 /DNA_START=42 /DNA_END=1595 /DNA_ORIENTATION=-
MGGAVSRLEETDWKTVTGKLTRSKETIDGSQPTKSYGVYYLHKIGKNQREYHVTDENLNLLYSSRMIDGTLAWFDVLGPGLNEFLLRVQVDLSRRYWVIYSYGSPSYAGQFADMTATNRLRQERGEESPCLYKKACITVTWSRYHAIINRYGPPPEEALSEERPTLASQAENSEESIYEEQPTWATPLKSSETVKDDKKEVSSCSNTDLNEDQADISTGLLDDTVLRENLISTNGIEGSGRAKLSRMSSVKSSMKQVKSSVKQWVADKTGANDPPPDPMEGHLQLDEPILKCEEISTFMGQHQTMLVGKEEARKLQKEELETAAQTGTDAHNPNANLNSDSFPREETSQQTMFENPTDQNITGQSKEELEASGKSTNDSSILKSSSFSSIRNFAKLAMSQVGETMDLTKSIVRAKSNPDYHKYQVADVSNDNKGNSWGNDLSNSSRKSVSSRASASSQGAEDEPLEPLVGFWNWDNTMRVHKMKMHLAKDSDLALHVVLAIVTNQLRLERNVVVSTV